MSDEHVPGYRSDYDMTGLKALYLVMHSQKNAGGGKSGVLSMSPIDCATDKLQNIKGNG